MRWMVRTGSAWRYMPHDPPSGEAVYQQTQRRIKTEELLALLRGCGLGERDAVRPDEPPVPWAELPSARLLVFCCLA